MSDIHFADYDADDMERKALDAFESLLNVGLGESDERFIYFRQILQIIIVAYARIDDTGRQNLLRYAKKEILDAIGEDRGVPRLHATPAQTTIQVTLSAPQDRNTLIPQGTRVTPDGKLFFYTTNLLTIPAGELIGEVPASCTESGTKVNGIRAGAIKTLVDPIPYVASITNITPTSGGADTELDDPYRERIWQAPERYTTTGTEEAYIFWAMTASPAIQDVKATNPGLCKVHLTVLAPPDDEEAIIAKVEEICAGKKRRTFTDHLTVSGPEPVPFDIDVTYSVTAEDEARVVAAIEGEGGAVDQYIRWQTGKLGREIDPDYLNMLMVQNGAFRLDIRAPTRQAVTKEQVARLASRSVSHGVMAWT